MLTLAITLAAAMIGDPHSDTLRLGKVEERRQSDSRLLANWFLVEGSPYMVAGDVFLPDGQIQKMTEVAIP